MRRFSLVSVVALSLVAGDVAANQIVPADCNLGFTNSYNPGNQVCVTGDVDSVPPGEICGAGYVYVFPAGWPNPYFDITNGQGIPNYISTCLGGGGFIDESVWLPPLKPGNYGLLLDEFPFGAPVGNEDVVLDNAFVVTNAPLVFTVDPIAIKNAAQMGLEAATSIKDLTLMLSILDTLSTAADWALTFGPWGGAAGVVLGVVCMGAGVDCPTSYNSAVIAIGNRILNGIADAQIKHYTGIIADPPDPNFLDIVPLVQEDTNMLNGPWTPLADNAVPNGQAHLANLLGVQAAAYQALLPTLEKVQGAALAGDHLGLLIQSEKLISYAQLARDAGDRMTAELDTLESYLAGEGTLTTTIDVQSVLTEVANNGLTAEERNTLYSFGLTDAEIDTAVTELNALPVPAEVSWNALISESRAMVNAMNPALNDLIAQAESVRQENEPFALRNRPVASINGPATGAVGSSAMLTAMATHLDPNAQLSYAWDTNMDGVFDDGSGPNLDFMLTSPGMTLVSVEVSDGTTRDVVTHEIDVAVSNVPPELVNLSPADPAPQVDTGSVVSFHAEGTDADGDTVTLSWLVDGAEQATGTDFDFTMPDNQAHQVRVVASDTDPFSPDAFALFTVRSNEFTPGAGGSGGGSGAGNGSGGGGGAGGDDGGDGDGCGCVTAGSTEGSGSAWLALLGLCAAVVRRRRRARG